MEWGAFRNNKISNLVISPGVTTIGENIFLTNNLSTLVIPSSVTTIESSAFYNNPFTSITIEGAYPQRFNYNWTSIGFPSSLMPQ
jgi:hypothetical protein